MQNKTERNVSSAAAVVGESKVVCETSNRMEVINRGIRKEELLQACHCPWLLVFVEMQMRTVRSGVGLVSAVTQPRPSLGEAQRGSAPRLSCDCHQRQRQTKASKL